MTSRLETGTPYNLAEYTTPNTLRDGVDRKKLPPHGVDPKTYSFLLTAIDYNKNVKNIFDKIDATTRNLIGVYFGTDISLTELASSTNLNRGTAKNKILRGLRTIWASTRPEIQQEYPKEEVIKMKDPTTILRDTHTKIAKTLWENPDYRKKVGEAKKKTGGDPSFIQRMRQLSQGRPSPMEGKRHLGETVDKIRESLTRSWAVRKFVKSNLGIDITQRTEDGKRLYKDTMRIAGPTVNQAISFLNGLQENPYEIVGRRVLERDIKIITGELINNMQTIFSALSTDELKKRATELEERLETFKEQLQARRAHRIETQIGIEEMSIWQQIKDGNLRNKIVKTGQITHHELDMITDYFEKKIIRVGLKIESFDRLTIGSAQLVAAGEIP